MPRISQRYPLCVAVMHPKTIHAFCVIHISLSAVHSSRDRVCLTGYKWRQTHPKRNCVSLSISEVHIEDTGRTFHIYYSSANKMSRPNEQQKH